jgi:RNA polymerase sigma-70 factor (ECF subfamily)
MPPPDLNRYRALLRLHVRQLQLGRLYFARFDSSDVVQEAMLRAVRGLDQLQAGDEAGIVAWLREVVVNVFIDLVRWHDAEKRDPRREQAIDEAVGDADTPLAAYLTASRPGPSTLAVRSEELLRLAEAMDRLPDAERDAVITHSILELPLAEVATRLGRTEKAAAGLVFRGKRRLREIMTASEGPM